MDKTEQLFNTIYLGDRYSERFEIQKDKIMFQINLISRLEPNTTIWNYYSGGDIEHGCMVFEEVADYRFVTKRLLINNVICEPSVYEEYEGLYTVNDEIGLESVSKEDNGYYTFIVEGVSASEVDVCTFRVMDIIIKAKRFYLYNPNNGSIITE